LAISHVKIELFYTV